MKEIVDKLSKTTDNFERANLLRQSAVIMYHENINKNEDLANYILDDVLKSYREVVTAVGEGAVNNYTGRVLELLKKSGKQIDLSTWTMGITLDDVPMDKLNYPCKGEYVECKYKEVTDDDLEKFSKLLREELDKNDSRDSAEEIRYPNFSFGRKIRDDPKPSTSAAHFSTSVNKIRDDPVPSTSAAHFSTSVNKVEYGPSTIKRSNPFLNTNIDPESNAPITIDSAGQVFKTAREELAIQNNQRYGNRANPGPSTSIQSAPPKRHKITGNLNYAKIIAQQQYQINQDYNQLQRGHFSRGAPKKSLGARRTVQSEFVLPVRNDRDEASTSGMMDYRQPQDDESEDVILDERLKHIEPRMIELISSEIMSKFKPVAWDDIAGLEYAKSTIQEAVVWPMLRPDIFTGLRRPPRGILLFGPPGTGKTLIGKCIASQSNSTFFSISASSLTSKWIGDGEKMVRALFAVAAVHQPSVIFIDEVDSLLCQRSETEHESSRRIKTEFLVQLDGAVTSDEDRILIIGATNRPQELDEAARRRFTRRLYIPLPEQEARLQILKNLLGTVHNSLTDSDIDRVSKLSCGYSGADMESLCREASMEPVRSIPPSQILNFDAKEVRPVEIEDFHKALNRIRASVSQDDLQQYVRWNEVYGSGASR